MDESRYHELTDAAFRRIEDAFESIDADDVDLERAGDVLTLLFGSGVRCVVNTQRPTRQIWLAANARAWHFSFDEPSGRWLDDKGSGLDLFAAVTRVVKETAGIDVAL